MSYDPTRQFRCDIVRSRAVSFVEDVLSAYAKIIDDLCPCNKRDFDREFDAELRIYLQKLGKPAGKKSLRNHRTETSKTLFGMYYVDENNVVYESERTRKFLKDNDQPAFFKDICYKLQFPNGMTSDQTLTDRISMGIKCYPCRIVVAVLQEAQNKGLKLKVREIGYYVLNSMDVLTGNATPREIIKQIKADRNAHIIRTINTGKNDPWDWEHIQGILNYLYLANLIDYSLVKKRNKREREVVLNVHESETLKKFASGYSRPLMFDISNLEKYPRNTPEERKAFGLRWDKYNGQLSKHANDFCTLPSCLGIGDVTANEGKSSSTKAQTAVIGRLGEAYALKYEKDELGKIDPSLADRVRDRSDERGIGYDIESVDVEKSTITPKYIEVKTTTRVTLPSKGSYWDEVTLTRNEKKAADEHKERFYLYRVYLTKGNVHIYQMRNIYEKSSKQLVDIDAPAYEMRFDLGTAGVIDKKIDM